MTGEEREMFRLKHDRREMFRLKHDRRERDVQVKT